MRISYVPHRTDSVIEYAISTDRITVTMDGVQDVFDFSTMPDGETSEIHSILDPCPVLNAKRVDGELHVTLIRPIGPRPSDPEAIEAWKRLWTDDLEEVR